MMATTEHDSSDALAPRRGVARTLCLLTLVALPAACKPATFDNLTGAPADQGIDPRSTSNVVDPTLAAPRQVAPLSVTWVDTLRPKFRWAAAEGSIGAIVELSKSRDFKGEVRNIVGTGTEVVAPADLEPGVWFWRLRGRSAAAEGEVKPDAPVWELLVRGPSTPLTGAAKPNDTPNGAMVDINGDGEADLVISFEAKSPTDAAAPHEFVPFILLGRPDHTFSFDESASIDAFYGPSSSYDFALAGGIDFNGDGFSDLARAELWKDPANPAAVDSYYEIHYGGLPGYNDTVKAAYDVSAPQFDAVPALRAAGDVNGDGYGDLLVSLPNTAFTALGGSAGPSNLLFMTSPYQALPASTTPIPPTAACDLDGDGFSDVVLGVAIDAAPVSYARGSNERFSAMTSPAMTNVTPSAVTSLTNGDFDGNGVIDIAFASQIKDATTGELHSAVCVFSHNDGGLREENCWKSAAVATPGFGVALVAGDLDADGRDEILVAGDGGVTILSRKKDGSAGFDEQKVAGAFLPSIAMIYPGRPGPARWAVVTADNASVKVFHGLEVLQTLPGPTQPWFVSFGRVIR